jgi:hypothetical protein
MLFAITVTPAAAAPQPTAVTAPTATNGVNNAPTTTAAAARYGLQPPPSLLVVVVDASLVSSRSIFAERLRCPTVLASLPSGLAARPLCSRTRYRRSFGL